MKCPWLLRRAGTAAGAPLLAAAVLFGLPAGATAQVTWERLVFTLGGSLEGYEGNFSSVTVPVVDSTEDVTASVGELSAAGALRVIDDRLRVRFDVGLRQSAASGFRVRDYAPREWVGRIDLDWGTRVGSAGTLALGATGRGRIVADRPPLPLFLQPGYGGLQGLARFDTRVIQDVRFDVTGDVERTDYDAPTLLSQLDLLDRASWGIEVGTSFGPLAVSRDVRSGWSLRFHTGFRRAEFKNQSSFDPADPFRRDRTLEVGGTWRYEGPLYAELGLAGTVNRSNSKRPEYDAVTVHASFSSLLPWWSLGVSGLAEITGKSYVHESQFARLVPGEEADNASVVFVELDRPVADNLSAATRFGWTRAETDFGESYYSRFGVTFLLRFRPLRPGT